MYYFWCVRWKEWTKISFLPASKLPVSSHISNLFMLSETDQIVSYFETVHDKQKGINIMMNFIICTSTLHYCCCWPTSLFSYFLVLKLKLETTILTCGPKKYTKREDPRTISFCFQCFLRGLASGVYRFAYDIKICYFGFAEIATRIK